MTHFDWPDKCSTCGKDYRGKEIIYCSYAFHCCRICIWDAGVRVATCKECIEEEKHAEEQWKQSQDTKE